VGNDPFLAIEPALKRALELAGEYLADVGSRPVSRTPSPETMRSLLDEPLPETGADAAATIGEWFVRAEPGIVASGGPRFFGFVNGGSTPAALGGDWLASAIDQNAGMWLSSPAASQTEQTVLRWLKELFGLPAAWAGSLTTGATMANLVGLAAGRQWVGARMGFDPAADGLGGKPPIPVLSSTEIHASARKALGVLGLGRTSVQTIDAPGGSVDLAKLKAALERLEGPALIVGNAAEVNTGAFDDLAALADLRDGHAPGAWLHVDAAFGLFAGASPAYAHFLNGLDRADSVSADAHKWLNVPYESGFAFVRDPEVLRSALAAAGAYLVPPPGAGWDPMSQTPEMSRRFRALPIWCTLKAAGRAGYREIVERCCRNAADFGEWVAREPVLELMAPVPLNIVCFRALDPARSDEENDLLNRRVVQAIQSDGRAFVTGTVWSGRAAIRAAFDNWATTAADVRILEETVAEIAERTRRE
jgi:glutamate/tyrosine decarboxylase-like PLP-dependent enzyme